MSHIMALQWWSWTFTWQNFSHWWFLALLIRWFIDSLFHWFIDSLIHSFMDSVIHLLADFLILWFIQPSSHEFTHSLLHWCIDSQNHRFSGSVQHFRASASQKRSYRPFVSTSFSFFETSSLARPGTTWYLLQYLLLFYLFSFSVIITIAAIFVIFFIVANTVNCWLSKQTNIV